MSIMDKVIAAVIPPESDEARAKARAKARASASPGDWLSLILKHHVMIEAAFAAVKDANLVSERVTAQEALGIVLTGHSIAEEAAIYPGLADAGEKGHAGTAYTEQSAAKVQLALLEKLPPMSQDFLDKLEHIRGAVAHHMFEEEGHWFPELKSKASTAEQTSMTKRYLEEFSRYVGDDVSLETAA